MLIDKNGTIKFQSLGLTISPGFTLDDLKLSSHFKDLTFVEDNGHNIIYRFKDVIIDDLYFGGELIFYENKICGIRMLWNTLKGKTREEWKIINELVKKKHDELLIQQHGKTRKEYAWGSVNSIQSHHTGDPEISIGYNILRKIS